MKITPIRLSHLVCLYQVVSQYQVFRFPELSGRQSETEINRICNLEQKFSVASNMHAIRKWGENIVHRLFSVSILQSKSSNTLVKKKAILEEHYNKKFLRVKLFTRLQGVPIKTTDFDFITTALFFSKYNDKVVFAEK